MSQYTYGEHLEGNRGSMNTYDITPFCGPAGTRFNIDKPWFSGGSVIATDGKILIVIERSRLASGADVSGPEKKPRHADVLLGFDDVSEWHTLLPAHRCDNCGDTGIAACEDCDGRGCESCDYDGMDACYECAEMLSGKKVRAQYVRDLLRVFGSVEYGTLPKIDDHRVFFRFDGGVGVAMCLAERTGE